LLLIASCISGTCDLEKGRFLTNKTISSFSFFSAFIFLRGVCSEWLMSFLFLVASSLSSFSLFMSLPCTPLKPPREKPPLPRDLPLKLPPLPPWEPLCISCVVLRARHTQSAMSLRMVLVGFQAKYFSVKSENQRNNELRNEAQYFWRGGDENCMYLVLSEGFLVSLVFCLLS
jgi:hypothetical protein